MNKISLKMVLIIFIPASTLAMRDASLKRVVRPVLTRTRDFVPTSNYAARRAASQRRFVKTEHNVTQADQRAPHKAEEIDRGMELAKFLGCGAAFLVSEYVVLALILSKV